MNNRFTIKRDTLLTEMVEEGLDSKALNDICDTVEKMNDGHLVGVVVDTLLDIRDILKLNDAKISYFQRQIEARHEAVIHNLKQFNGYGMMQNSASNAKLERINTLKDMINPLLNRAIELRKTTHNCVNN